MHNWSEVAAAAENGPSVEVSAFDRYFYDRLNGSPVKHEVLSKLPYHGALGLCDVMGAMIVMDAVIEGWRDSVPMLFARERLGSSPQVVRQLAAAGILSMASEKSDHALKNLFSRKQIEAVIARLEGLASHANVDAMVSLKSCVPFMSFSNQIAGMLEGKIPLSIIKKEGEPTTLEHLRVDAGVVRAIAGIGAPGGYISANGVTTRIAAVIDTVQRLAARGIRDRRVSERKRPHRDRVLEIVGRCLRGGIHHVSKAGSVKGELGGNGNPHRENQTRLRLRRT